MADKAHNAPNDSEDNSKEKKSLSSKIGFSKQDVSSLQRSVVGHIKEIIGGVLIFSGIVSTFFSSISSLLVAGGFIVSFYPELRKILNSLPQHYADNGPIKNIVLCGLLLFFGIKMTGFTLSFILICAIIAFVAKDAENDSGHLEEEKNSGTEEKTKTNSTSNKK
ncbi:hypothetical protein [Chlamydiifrater phoenicopteri]|uniref:hypothetical protein n=1 Tax=Chlamydiifrater phoenicopteri TaxID=2681469 RepID=UPI001BD119BF|nr:hypothetical protein [Chlamydiifrater phoenicopteri]